MKRRNILIIVFCLIAISGIFVFWQYALYLKLSKVGISCGGEWSHNIQCPVGSSCQSLRQGPLAGGLCQPFFSPLFNFFDKQKQTPIEIFEAEKDKEGAETANWKSYSDPDILKISLKYPIDWKVEFEAHIGKDSPAFSSPCNYDGGQRCSNLDIGVEPYEKGKSLESYFNFDFTGKWPDKIIRKENLKIGGEDALATEYLLGNYFYGGGENDHGLVLIRAKANHNQQVFTFSFSEVGKDRAQIKTSADWRNKQIFYQILSTFKFTDQSLSPTPSETTSNISSQACGGPRAVEPNNGCPMGYYCGDIISVEGETSGRCIKN